MARLGHFDPVLGDDFNEVGLGVVGNSALQSIRELRFVLDEDVFMEFLVERDE